MLHLLAFVLVWADTSIARPLESAEFMNTADTLPKKAICLHPFSQRSSFAITDRVEIKSGLINWYWGADTALEVGVLRDDVQAISAEVDFAKRWDDSEFDGGGNLRYTRALGPHRLNASVGGGYAKASRARLPTPTSRLGLGIDLVANEATTFQFAGRFDALSLVAYDYMNAEVGFTWNHGWDSFRLGLGINVRAGEHPTLDDVFYALGMTPPEYYVFPLPSVALWWRI
jgi:hypothetical protein